MSRYKASMSLKKEQIEGHHAEIGCKVVWFPAFDAMHCRKEIGLKKNPLELLGI